MQFFKQKQTTWIAVLHSITQHSGKTLEHTVKNKNFQAVMLHSSEKAQHLGGSHYIHPRSWRIRQARNQQK
jgi:hypothetical protein